MTIFLRNAWYCAAWAAEVTREPFARILMDEPVLLYRTQGGDIAALSDRCPHRYAPLHQGKLQGDIIACPYHGLEFDPTGACVHNPHGAGKLPLQARLKVYPLVERHQVAWIWMGDAKLADPALIPERPECATDCGWTTVTGYLPVSGHTSLVIDNLMDLTHSGYLHGDSVSVAASVQRPEITSGVDADGVFSRFLTRRVPPPGPFRSLWPDELCDYHRESRWIGPSLIRTKIGVSKPDERLDDGIFLLGYHLLSPQSDLNTHYFWSASRRFNRNDAGYDAQLQAIVDKAFATEDEPMIAACQRYMGSETNIFSLAPALLETDRPSVLVHRAVEKRIRAEARLRVQQDEARLTR